MDDNSRSTPDKENLIDSASQKAGPASHFKRTLVPLDEYASREGISSDIIEKQGQLGVLQIRKFKGQKFVVDVPVEQLEEYENEEDSESLAKSLRPRTTTASKFLTIALTVGFMIIIVSVLFLYIDSRQKLNDLMVEYTSLQNKYNDLTSTNKNLKSVQNDLADSKAEFARIQNRIAESKTDLEKIQSDLSKSRRNLETIQSDLTTIQGQLSLSKVEIESTQNGLNETKGTLDKMHQQNAGSQSK
jgi:archaellum component FlaC